MPKPWRCWRYLQSDLPSLPSLCSIARRTAIKAATLRQDLRIVT
ncbi:hypothetical protein QUA41_23335 [Microcoleus sp. Pol11C1]